MLNRRTFLSVAGASAFAPAFMGDADASPREEGVIVVGAGLSGLAAALDLAKRGVKVEIIEASEQLGGRAKAGLENRTSGRLSIGHAPFLLPYQAVHVEEMLSRLDLGACMAPFVPGPAYFLDGNRIDPEHWIGKLRWIRALWHRARHQGHRVIPKALRDGKRWNASLASNAAWEGLGGLSALDWHQSPSAPLTPWKAFRDVMSPCVFGTAANEVDAASFALAEQFYALGTPKNRWTRRLTANPQEALWGPLQEALVDMGVHFRMGVTVSELSVSSGRVSGLVLDGFGLGLRTDDVQQGWTEVVRPDDASVFVFRNEMGELRAFSGRCPSTGCRLEWTGVGFFCSCQKRTYREDGHPESGDGAGLQRLYVLQGADGVHVEGEDSRVFLPASSVILACGPTSSWEIAGDLLGIQKPPMMREQASAHFWWDGDLLEDSPSWVLSDEGAGTSATVLSRLESESAEWANTGGTVIAVQTPMKRGGEQELLDSLRKHVEQVWPELQGARLVDQALSRWEVPVPEPGWRQGDPQTEAVFPGLYAAGEHLATDSNAHGFEAAARSGRLAANLALRDLGLEPTPLLDARE